MSRRLAAAFWPDGEPLGQQIRFENDRDTQRYTVIGVSADLSNWDLGMSQPAVFVPMARGASGSPRFVIRAAGDADAIADPIVEVLRSSGIETGTARPQSLEDARAMAFARQGVLSRLFQSLSVVTVFLSAVGVFGLLSYLVTRRAREIGIRIALGARRPAVLGLVMRQAALIVGVGLAIGLPAAYATSQVLERILFQTDAADPFVFLRSAGLAAVTVVAASWTPAWRAASVDPVTTLR